MHHWVMIIIYVCIIQKLYSCKLLPLLIDVKVKYVLNLDLACVHECCLVFVFFCKCSFDWTVALQLIGLNLDMACVHAIFSHSSFHTAVLIG
jgi:hypothetical protein